jgi:hypothetical protein
MPNICLIYTDTNGLHKTNENVSSKNLYKFARVIAIHYMVGTYNEGNFKELFTKHIILKPKTINFDKDAQNIHNITIDEATKYGIDNITAINELKKDFLFCSQYNTCKTVPCSCKDKKYFTKTQ